MEKGKPKTASVVASFEAAQTGLHTADEASDIALQARQIPVSFGVDFFQLCQPEFQVRQFALPEFRFHPLLVPLLYDTDTAVCPPGGVHPATRIMV